MRFLQVLVFLLGDELQFVHLVHHVPHFRLELRLHVALLVLRLGLFKHELAHREDRSILEQFGWQSVEEAVIVAQIRLYLADSGVLRVLFAGHVGLVEEGVVRVDGAEDAQEPVGVRVGLVLHAEVHVVLLAELDDLLEDALLLWRIRARPDLHISVVRHIVGAGADLLEVVDGVALRLEWRYTFAIALKAFPELALAGDEEARLGLGDVALLRLFLSGFVEHLL